MAGNETEQIKINPDSVTGISNLELNKNINGGPLFDQSYVKKKSDVVSVNQITPTQKRKTYPFDSEDSDETYMSELEENDEVEFTYQRRRLKDNLELELRMVDSMENPEQTGDEEKTIICLQFNKTVE